MGDTSILDRALELIRAGDTVGAEELALDAAARAALEHGEKSPARAAAENELGIVLLNVGARDRAIQAFRAAAAGDWPADQLAQRDHLTYLMNLGKALTGAGELDEAEQALQSGLEGRERFYGRAHAGYAFGLEPLAELLLEQGRPADALPLIEETVENFWANGHERVAGALALRGVILASLDAAARAFVGLEGLPDPMVRATAAAVAGRVSAEDAIRSRALLDEADGWVRARLGPADEARLQLQAAAFNLETALGPGGDNDRRIQASLELLRGFDAQGDQAQSLSAMLSLALAQSQAGRVEPALASYRSALERALQGGDGGQETQVRRNLGLYLAEIGRRAEAELELRGALAAAAAAGLAEERGRAGIALGIFLQHGGDRAAAGELLAASVGLLSPADADAVCGRSHLGAIRRGAETCCGDQQGAIVEAFEELVRSRLPPDLPARVEASLGAGGFHIEVHADRPLTEEEVDGLNRVVSHSLEEFRRGLSQRR